MSLHADRGGDLLAERLLMIIIIIHVNITNTTDSPIVILILRSTVTVDSSIAERLRHGPGAHHKAPALVPGSDRQAGGLPLLGSLLLLSVISNRIRIIIRL